MDEEILWYACPNDKCPLYESPIDITRGMSAECRECGWQLSALYD